MKLLNEVLYNGAVVRLVAFPCRLEGKSCCGCKEGFPGVSDAFELVFVFDFEFVRLCFGIVLDV